MMPDKSAVLSAFIPVRGVLKGKWKERNSGCLAAELNKSTQLLVERFTHCFRLNKQIVSYLYHLYDQTENCGKIVQKSTEH